MTTTTVTMNPPCALGESCPHCGGGDRVYVRRVCFRAYKGAESRALRRRSRGEPVSVADVLEELASRLGVSLRTG